MKTINVYGKEYKVKFGYLAVANSGILADVVTMIDKLEESNTDNTESVISVLDELVPLVSRMTLAGLQKKHADEFGVDYEDESEVKEKLNKVADLLDDYFDPEDGEEEHSMIELFWLFVNELVDSGFLSLNREKLEETPKTQDHKRKATK